jgi:thiamine-monophosphate kinase
MKADKISEDDLVRLLTARLPLGSDCETGIGDDCAVVRTRCGTRILLKTDCLLEDVHFFRENPAHLVGHKALARAVSDFAACAGTPRHALITLALPVPAPIEYVRGIYRGLAKTARHFGIGIVGGETSRSPSGIFLNVTLVGDAAPGPVLRSTARPGDAIFVTGRLGGSYESGRHLRFTPRLAQAHWLASHFPPSAMMDLSDGLAADLPRLAAASRVGVRVEPDLVPLQRGIPLENAACDGEDFELLFTMPPTRADQLPAAWKRAFPRLRLTRIGEILASPAATSLPWQGKGFSHL